MINIQEYIIKTMKKEMFNTSENINNAARQVLAELKTKFIDIKEPITSEIQYKLLKKMFAERIESIFTYTKANRIDLAKKEEYEKNIIDLLMSELEKDLPKMMTEIEIKNKIFETIKNIDKPNIGIIMKAFKNIQNVDKHYVSSMVNKILAGEIKNE